ncbi:alpha/beta fold hydrolase [Sphaerisporangium corydalis]|uniref:Alpha/beta fold hydrolase n=1 Tax=Sphaerisporangium corydalis TaxID=1441875 RepID=A0ABV9EKR8_9ACTN|nr:alpha/beta fold hydrolase [Sphaerisporangium corydalis]
MTGIHTSAEGARVLERRYREFLDQWPVPSEHLRVPTREGETFVVACGPADAPPVLLMHGSGANAAMWADDVTAWSEHLRLYAVDMIGEPGLSAPSRPPLDSGAYALWLDDVLAGLGVESAALVGVSLGGWLALDYAIRRPGRVGRVAVLCPGGVGGQRYGVLLLALLLMPFGRWGRRTTMRKVLGTTGPATPEERAVADYMQLVDRHFRYRRDRLPVFTDDALRGLAMPVLAVAGGRDALMDSAGTRRRLEENVPQATVRFLPEEGHLLRGQTGPVLDFLLAPDEAARPV